MLTTLVLGLRYVFVETPWQRDLSSRSIAPSSAPRPKACIIDSDHWRHYFLLLGVIWGLMAASQPYRRRLRRVQRAAAPAPPTLAPLGRAA